MNNAQAALQAAATVYSGGRGHTTPASVKLLAETFKNWLDHQDQAGRRVDEEPLTGPTVDQGPPRWPTGRLTGHPPHLP